MFKSSAVIKLLKMGLLGCVQGRRRDDTNADSLKKKTSLCGLSPCRHFGSKPRSLIAL